MAIDRCSSPDPDPDPHPTARRRCRIVIVCMDPRIAVVS
jgi:hypothetical protein